jgi:hypothetical protein
MLQIVKDGVAKTPADPASLGRVVEVRLLWIIGPQTYRILKSNVCSFVPDSIFLSEGSILRDLEIKSLIIIGGGTVAHDRLSASLVEKMCCSPQLQSVEVPNPHKLLKNNYAAGSPL